MDDQKRKSNIIKEYKKSLKQNILTSRFNNETYNENKAFRDRYISIGCVYCAPYPVTFDIPKDNVMFVLEMNNDINKIMGIGMITNRTSRYIKSVYKHGNYNRHIYIGKYRIDRSEFTAEEETIIKAFDRMCFKSNHHMKRGQGLLHFPIESLYRVKVKVLDLVEFVNNMFKRRVEQKCINSK